MRLVQARIWTATEPCPYRGAYTVLLTGEAGDPASPAGTGFAHVVVNDAGLVQIAGALPDGTHTSQGARISADGEWPLYHWIYEGSGALRGWMQFVDERISSTGAALRWIKPLQPSAALHRKPFSVLIFANGSRYAPLSPVWNPIPSMQLVFGGSDLTALPAPSAVTPGADNTMTTAVGSGVRMTFSTATGLFSGRFVSPGERDVHNFRGTILQSEIRGAGFFRGRAKSGFVSFERRNAGK